MRCFYEEEERIMSEKKGFFGRAFDNMKESAKKQHAIKADSKDRFEDAKRTSPDMQEFKDAKGLKEKAKVVLSHMERDAKQITEENRQNYKEMLEEQRKQMNKNINK